MTVIHIQTINNNMLVIVNYQQSDDKPTISYDSSIDVVTFNIKDKTINYKELEVIRNFMESKGHALDITDNLLYTTRL